MTTLCQLCKQETTTGKGGDDNKQRKEKEGGEGKSFRQPVRETEGYRGRQRKTRRAVIMESDSFLMFWI